ncbi:MAG TPA: RNA polymerase sigma factor, partial [Clostridiales bacterium]|nr:RNA polymerase sigma factor [Clostridiales bacterium]
DINLAEDIVQDAFVDIYIYKERYNFKSSFKTYLFTIGRNKAIDYIRKFGREISSGEVFESSQYSDMINFKDRMIDNLNNRYKSPEENAIRNEDYKIVHTGLGKIKKEYSIAIHLIDLEGLSYAEAGQIMKKTMPQIKVLVYRARKALAKALREDGFIYEDR